MTLPPWMRVIQQSWYFHIFIATLIGSVLTTFGCFHTANDAFTWPCLRTGLIGFVVSLCLSSQHPPGSPMFKPDGEVNQPVKQAVEMQAAGIPVKVVAAK